MRTYLMVLALLPLASACSEEVEDGLTDSDVTDPGLIDTDGDGLTDAEEAELGTDPALADTDGDGLTDYQEAIELNTNPVEADSDMDGFSDGEEIADGTDPLDHMSYVRSTEGRWPDLASHLDTSTAEGWGVGDRFMNATVTDQYGQTVDLYQFAGNVMLIDFSAGWCGPCRAVARTIETEYRERADEGFVIVHLMIDDNTNGGGVTDGGFLKQWADQYGLTFPVTEGAVARDVLSGLTSTGLFQKGIPFMILLDQNMTIVQAETGPGSESRLLSTADRLLVK